MKLFLASVAANCLDKIVELLSKSPKSCLVAFIPTAADTYKDKWFVEEDRDKLRQMGFKIKDLDIKNKNKQDLLSELKEVDVIFVAGGNVFYLLQETRKSGFDEVVRELIKKDVVYVGSSAGSILVGPTIEPMKDLDKPSEASSLESFEGLNLIDFVVCPHFGDKKYKSQYMRIIKEFGVGENKLLALANNQALIVNKGLLKIVET